MMTKKEQYKFKHLLHLIKTEPIKMFCDFQNECNFLYDEISIDEDTINFINDYFCFYDVDVKKFYSEFRNTLRLILPRYYKLLKIEIDNDITKIYNNIKFKRVCIATSDDAMQNKFNKNNKDVSYNENYENITNISENGTSENTNKDTTNYSKNIETNSETNEKVATKENPLSNEANNFNDLFNWDTSTSVNETEDNSGSETSENGQETKNQTLNGNTTNNREDVTNGNRDYTEQDVIKSKENLRKIAKGLKDNEEITSEINNLIVENVNTIVNYLFKNNRASDYLINNLKKCFIGIYYYN